jgi:predicted O-methyltransferase YrrM
MEPGLGARSGLALLQQYYEQRPLDLDNDRFVEVHEWFLRELPTIAPEDHLDETDLTSYRELCSRCHKRYVAIKEAQANKILLAIAKNAGTSTGEKLSGFGRMAYDRVRDLKTLVDFRSCKKVAMVGSGAFPATLLWLRDHFPTIHYVGLDIDSSCVKLASELVAALGFDNVQFKISDGRQYDFGGIDFVYVAAYVTPKRAVLEQIARSPSVRQVVVREPTPRGGELLAEAVRPHLPPFFVADAAGAVGGIMSYDLRLRRG